MDAIPDYESAIEIIKQQDEHIAALTARIERMRGPDDLLDSYRWRVEYQRVDETNQALAAELATLRSENEQLKAPVSPEEWVFHGGVNFSDAHKKALSRILESRTQATQKGSE